ncbi:MAG: apolipoprotein N-acyltransferase [Rhodothermales bacterium]
MPHRTRRAVAVISSGVLLGLSFPPFPPAPLAWIALVPLCSLWLERRSGRAAFVDAYVAFLVTFGIAFHWPLFHVDADTALLSLPVLLVIPMWMAVPFGLSAVLKQRLGPAAALVGLTALYVVMEWGLRRGPLAFPWTLLGHTQSNLAPIHTLARYGGVPLLTLFVLCFNLFMLTLVIRIKGMRLPTAAIVAALGALALLAPPADESGRKVGVGLIQPAISADAWADLGDRRRVDVLLTLSDTLAAAARADSTERPGAPSRLDLIVWPETALPPGDARSRALVRRWVERYETPILSGAIEESAGGDAYFNTGLLIRPGGTTSRYRKRRLVPFAEHVPFQNRWPWIRALAVPSGGVAGYAQGSSDEPMEISSVRFGVVICFETLFDDIVRAYARRDAGLIVAITQDGWWGDSFGYRQHLAFTRLRAIEVGRPIVQVSVSGHSAIILSDGSVRGRLDWMERRAASGTVALGGGSTPYVRAGDWLSPLALLVAVLLAAAGAVRRPTARARDDANHTFNS